MSVPQGERITVHEAAKALGLSVRQMRRYKARLQGRLEMQDVIQPAQEVLTFDRAAFEQLKAEREGRSADEV